MLMNDLHTIVWCLSESYYNKIITIIIFSLNKECLFRDKNNEFILYKYTNRNMLIIRTW